MKRKNKAVTTTAPNTNTKVDKTKDIEKVLAYFQYTIGTTYDCAKATGIKRWSVTWYISMLQDMDLIHCVCRSKDRETGYMAKYYTVTTNCSSHIKKLMP